MRTMTFFRHRKHCFPFTCLSFFQPFAVASIADLSLSLFMFYLLFSFLLAGTTHPSKGILSLFPSSSSSSSASSEYNVRVTDRTRTRLAAASFFKRTDLSCVGCLSERRNFAATASIADRRWLVRLLLHPITNERSIGRGPGLLLHPFLNW